jgi:hypothetical protein
MKPTPPADNQGCNAKISPVDHALIEQMRMALDDMSKNELTSAASLRAFISCVGALAQTGVSIGSIEAHCAAASEGHRLAVEPRGHVANVGSQQLEESLRFKHFQIREMLGHGGFGVVFRAFDTMLGRDVALKLPRPEQLTLPDTKRRFLSEAQTAALLDHPGIVPVYETGELGALWYIASGFVEGPTLATWQQNQTAGISPQTAATVMATLADAMSHAHQRGVLHLDLKPSNVLLEPNVDSNREFPFYPRLTDFGLAGRCGHDGELERGVVAGTLRYMSPEQVRGDAPQIGIASDVYALGAMLYKLLTGQAPFEVGDQAAIARSIETEAPRPPRDYRNDCSRDLDAICLKCLAKQPEARYSSARALADDLRQFLRDEPVQARPVGVVPRMMRACRRRPALAAVCGGAALTVLLGAAGVSYQRAQAERHAAVARHEKSRADQQTQEAQQWLLEASQVIQETAPYLAQEQTIIEGLTARIHAHRAQLEKVNASEELHLATLTASASLDAMGAQQATPLQPGHIVESRTRHAVDEWLRVIERWPDRLAYRRALALLMLGAARYYERSELPHFARQYRAEAASVLSPTWYEGNVQHGDLADLARQLERLADVREGLGHTDNAHCLRQCAVENWNYLRTKSPANLEFLAGWAIAQRKVASSISTRQPSETRDQIFTTIESELDRACDWETAPASLQLVMADLMCRRASSANDRNEPETALELLRRGRQHLQLAEQSQADDADSRRIEIYLLRETAASHDAMGQEREAYDNLRHCCTMYRQRLEETSENEQEMLRYARLCRNVGTRAAQLGEKDAAIAAYSDAATIYAKRAHLSVKDLEANAQCVTSLAKLYASTGNEVMADSQFRLALDLWRKVQRRMPNSPAARAETALIERKLQE